MEQALAAVRQLVEDFKAQESYYLSADYQEMHAREDFINKFFAALGWDVTHTRQKNPYEQEVKIENKVNTQGSQRRADYAFFVAPNFRDVKFFAEAKKPHHGLANAEYYHQAIRYAWNKKTPIAVLTDFEEFHVIDCRYTPNMDTALDRKIEVFHYSDYADEEKFKRIFYLFGRDAVAAGSIEKFAADLPKPRGKAMQKGLFKGSYQPVDEAFLEALDGHRDTLARSFKSNNPDLNGEELTEAVQRTLDRLVFMRFLEDKQIEDPTVANFKPHPNPPLGKGRGSAWKAFVGYSKSLEPKYNGLIFKPHRIIDADDFTPPDDEQFADICTALADPTSPYDFDKIPIWILGSIYERFLGKVVRATDKRAKVEEKPEVRKAGGVYYTPEYIVRYIVKETVGKLIEGKTPAQIAEMAFADIACGSGSFLLEVYSTLIEYHTRWYNDNPTKAKKADVETRDGKLVLSLKKLQEILTNNIYGVDIDFQATEVTQLSLYLRLLEDVTLTQLHLFKEKVLPNLNRNIVCGNSLIEPDIESQHSLPFSRGGTGRGPGPDPAPLDHLKPMRFTDAFPDVMKRGGFDAVVGNPPYVRGSNLKAMNEETWKACGLRYKVASERDWDIYMVFVERGLPLLRDVGVLGFILPNKFLNSQVGANLREIIANGYHLRKLVHFGAFQIFASATTYTCLLFLSKLPNSVVVGAKYKGQVSSSSSLCPLPEDTPEMWSAFSIQAKTFTKATWEFGDEEGRILSRLRQWPPLSSVCEIFQGTGTRADKVFLVRFKREQGRRVVVDSAELEREVVLEKTILKPVLRGRSIDRYGIKENDLLLILPYTQVGLKHDLVSPEQLKELSPKTYDYLLECRPRLDEREKGRFKGNKWYSYGRPQNMERFETEAKIVMPDVVNRGSCFLDTSQRWLIDTCYAIASKTGSELRLEFIIAVLNSPLLTYFLKETGTALRGGYFRMKTAYLSPFPIRAINFSDPADKSRHDHIVKLVEQMLAAKEKLAAAKSDADVNRLEMQCEGLDRQIDEAVYELYGLTKEEIEIVEKG